MLKQFAILSYLAVYLCLSLLTIPSIWAEDPVYIYEKPPSPTLISATTNQQPAAIISATATTGVAPFLVQLTSNSVDPDGSIASVSWDFGDGNTSNGQTVTYTYTKAGKYTVKLTVVDNLGASSTAALNLIATTTLWALDGDTPPVVERLGSGWTQNNKTIACLNDQDGGQTRIRLDYAPNGIYDLSLKLFCSPLDKGDPQPRFRLDGQKYDFVPTEELGYQWLFIKVVQVVNNSYTFTVSDVPSGGIRIRSIKLEPHQIQGDPTLSLEVAPTSGERPLAVSFNASGGASYLWEFGDGTTSDRASATHIYQSIGTYTATLSAVDTSGNPVVASVLINVEPNAEDLIGLNDIQTLGIYSAGIQPNAAHKPETDAFNQRRIEELQNMHVQHIFLGFWSHWYDSDRDQAEYHALLDNLHAHGIGAIVNLTSQIDWFSNNDWAIPMSEWIFDVTEAEANFRATDRDRDGISDLDGRIDVLYLAHEVHEFANYAERVQMYQLAKRYFPNTPILMNYGGGLPNAFVKADETHKAGGFQRDYQFGPGETDIIFIGSGQPFIYDADGNRQYAIQTTIDGILSSKQYANAIAPELPIWVNVNFSSDEIMDTDPNSMWQPNEILGWAKCVLSIGDIQGMFFRSYDRFTYDLGYGVNTANPAEPETGFIEQREAVKTIGQWILQGSAF